MLLIAAPLITGCAGASDMFSSDLLSKDADWFARPGRVFIKNVSIETPPLTPDKPVTPDDLISADGLCPGMAPQGGPANANALSDGAAAAPTTPVQTGVVALGHTECDVARGAGAPDKTIAAYFDWNPPLAQTSPLAPGASRRNRSTMLAMACIE